MLKTINQAFLFQGLWVRKLSPHCLWCLWNWTEHATLVPSLLLVYTNQINSITEQCMLLLSLRLIDFLQKGPTPFYHGLKVIQAKCIQITAQGAKSHVSECGLVHQASLPLGNHTEGGQQESSQGTSWWKGGTRCSNLSF